jgi:serine/threonine protein kinase
MGLNLIGGMGLNLTRSQIALDIGSVVAGKFRIDRILAEGGMGLVVAATHIHLEQTVALKFFRGDLGTEGEPLMRFMREAKAAAQLKSEHVARVLDVGVTDGGTPYMVMEYLEGQGLDSVVAAEGPMDAPSATEFAIQACEGLAEAHARGIIHRDIKPSNLFLVERSPGWRTIKILDFGISKVSLAQAANITTNLTMGTPCYMSPEQLQSTASVDHRTDIWSLGSSLYELLAGRSPFNPRLPLLAIAEEIVNKKAPSVFELRPEVPQELSAVVARCMAKDRDERFESAAALAMALLPFARARARVPAERAASMTPAFGVVKTEPRTNGDAGTQWGVVTQGMPWDLTPPARQNPLAPLEDDTTPYRSTATPEAESETMKPNPRSGPSRLTVAMGALALMFVVATVAYRNARRQPPPPPVASGPAMSVAPPVSAAPPPPAYSELVVRVTPPSARITIDGAAVPDNPFRGHFRRGETHQIRASAPGYEPKLEQAVLANDVLVNLSLDKKQKSGSARRATAAAAAAAAGTTNRAPKINLAETTNYRPTEVPAARIPAFPVPEVVDPAGGRAPIHPIHTKSPYEAP